MSNKRMLKKYKLVTPSDAVKSLSKEAQDFINLGDYYNIDFNAWYVMFNMWLNLPSAQKEAVILQLIKDGKVDIDKDARKNSESK